MDTQGTVDSTTATIASTPYRIVAAASDSNPIMNPGSSTKLTIGRWNVSQRFTKRRTFWAPSAPIEPP